MGLTCTKQLARRATTAWLAPTCAGLRGGKARAPLSSGWQRRSCVPVAAGLLALIDMKHFRRTWRGAGSGDGGEERTGDDWAPAVSGGGERRRRRIGRSGSDQKSGRHPKLPIYYSELMHVE